MPSREPRPSKGHAPSEVPVGLVGLGRKAAGIAACLLAAGHPVIAVEKDAAARRSGRNHVRPLLAEPTGQRRTSGDAERRLAQFRVSGDYGALRDADLVIEATDGNARTKRQVVRAVERAVSAKAVIGSDSAIPVAALQEGALHPERILGIRWGEPPHITRFLEVACGPLSAPAYAEGILLLARRWGKDPTLVRRGIRGFVSSRILAAMLREAFQLVESGVAEPAEVDRSVRNDIASSVGFAGLFRLVDLAGIPACEALLRDLLPELSNRAKVPPLLRRARRLGAEGISNTKGFYTYTPAEARHWEARFREFSEQMRALFEKYPADFGDRT